MGVHAVYVDTHARIEVEREVILAEMPRIEILKGPQGTLFGRNTIGGAISIVTRTPGKELALDGQVTGGSYDRRDISFMADVPLAENLLSSITFSSQYRRGYQERVAYPGSGYVSDPVGAMHASGTQTFDTQGGTNQQILRGKLVRRPPMR